MIADPLLDLGDLIYEDYQDWLQNPRPGMPSGAVLEWVVFVYAALWAAGHTVGQAVRSVITVAQRSRVGPRLW